MGGDPLRQQGAASALDPSGGRWPRLSVPAPRWPRHSGRWEVILSALDSWAGTLRLCLILFVAAVAPCLAAVAAVLIRHILLCGSAAMRRHARGLGPAPSFGDPLRDGGLVGSGQPAQMRGLASQGLV